MCAEIFDVEVSGNRGRDVRTISHIEVSWKCNRNRDVRRNLSYRSDRKMQSRPRCSQKSITWKFQEIAIATAMCTETSHLEVSVKCNRNRDVRRNPSHWRIRKMQSYSRCARKFLRIKVLEECNRNLDVRITAATANYNSNCQLYLQPPITNAFANHDRRNINAGRCELARCGDDFLYAVSGSAFCVSRGSPRLFQAA